MNDDLKPKWDSYTPHARITWKKALTELGFDATDELAEQLYVFCRAIKIYEERTAELGCQLWRDAGAADAAHHIKHKATRLFVREHHEDDLYDPDDALDLINYAAFYVRLKEDG